jgi:hypothetical protein
MQLIYLPERTKKIAALRSSNLDKMFRYQADQLKGVNPGSGIRYKRKNYVTGPNFLYVIGGSTLHPDTL